MFELFSKYDVPEAKIICADRILGTLDESNAVEVFILAHQHQSDQLKRGSFEVVKKNVSRNKRHFHG